MKNKLFAILLNAFFCALNVPAFAVEPSICYEEKFSEALSMSIFPSQVIKSLKGISDRGAPFNSGDVGGPTPPRVNMAAVSENCILVAVEHGGMGYGVDLWIFLRNGSNWQKGATLVIGKAPNSLNEFLTFTQNLFGDMYAHGDNVVQNDLEAIKWYRRAADQGYAPAQYALGGMYANGRGVEKSEKEAIKWFKLAASKVISWQNEIGVMYETGNGLTQNYTEAIKCFRIAADKGDYDTQLEALRHLGAMYAAGQGVTKNRIVAFALLTNSNDESTYYDGKRSVSVSITEIKAAKTLRDEIAQTISKNGSVTATLDRYLAR